MKKILLLSTFCFSLFSFGQVPSYVPTNGLVGWWGFNGNANDESGNGNNGTVNGPVLTTDRYGNTNSAYDFDGDDWISVANNASLNLGFSDYTISVWVNKDNAAPSLQNIIGKQETTAGDYYGWTLGLVNNEVRFIPGTGFNGGWLYNGTIQSNFSILDNQWYFICGVFDLTNTLTSLYINGILYTTTTASSTVNPDNSQDLKFGVYMPTGAPSGPEFFFGIIDDIGIWNRALNTCEIQDLFNAQLNSSNGVNAGVDQTVCEGNSVTLSGSGGINYQWNNNVIDGVSFTPITTQDYILTGEDVNGCIGLDTVTVEVLSNSTSSETVTECDSYTWNTNGQTYTQSGQYTEVLTNQGGCDSTVTLNLTITNSTTGSETVTECDSYTWSTNGQTYTQSGQYTEVLTNTAGCDSTVTLDLMITSVNNNITQVDDITLQSDVMNAQYQWVDCDEDFQPIIGETGQVFVANANGNYAVIVSENNCSDTSACITISKVGLDDINKNIFNVYPNPTSNSFTISSEKVINSEFKIIDSQGREVLTGSMNGQEHTIDISKLSKGVYSVVFNNTEYPVVSVIKE